MPQKIVPLVCDELYHVYNRGVDKRETFLDKEDYLRFYQSLHLFNTIEPTVNFDSAKIKSKKNNEQKTLVEIKAYSLLPNHYHLILKQNYDNGISEFMRRISTGYTSYFNQKNERSGSLFQGRFKRIHIATDEQYNYLFAYVNENHFVHNLNFDREICHSSSLHYQKVANSKLIKNGVNDIKYNFESNVSLAISIGIKRKKSKLDKELFD